MSIEIPIVSSLANAVSLSSSFGNSYTAGLRSLIEKKTEKTIIYDNLFMRKFFRDYLSGTDFIKIIFKEKIPKNDKKRLYDFIQNSFMNVQIIEETPERIVLQNFRLEGISIKSCFQRMNHITASMFEDILNNEKGSAKEKEKNLKEYSNPPMSREMFYIGCSPSYLYTDLAKPHC